LEECLAQEFHDEEIDEYSCDNCARATTNKDTSSAGIGDTCGKRPKAHVSNRIQRLPPYLFTVVRRFEDMRRKDNRSIALAKGNTLSLVDYVTDSCAEAGKSYNLLGTVDHHGSAFGGHYVAQVHHLGNGNWYLYDDETAHQIRTPMVGSSTYIMAWHRGGESA
jgi:ubiquitin C-terminal hydrolase